MLCVPLLEAKPNGASALMSTVPLYSAAPQLICTFGVVQVRISGYAEFRRASCQNTDVDQAKAKRLFDYAANIYEEGFMLSTAPEICARFSWMSR